ncbi:MAG: hypothetical protein [Caudoviricetes sp.]|nr:MAG: hypothetical protein [Caudoviricetes sp.]
MKLALILFMAFSLFGFVLLIIAAYLIFGYQYSILTASLCSFVTAYFIKRGLTNG